MKKPFLLFSLFSLIFSLEIAFSDFVVPPLPSTPVYDEVGILTVEEKTSLEEMILILEKETTHQIGVAIIQSLQERTIEEVGIVLARSWGIGQKGLDNGLLILIAPTEREMRIEVGRGLEGVMTDLMSQRVIDENFTPHFREENYGVGLAEGIERISPLLRGEVVELPEQAAPLSDMIMVIFIVLFTFGWILLSILSSTKSWWLGGVVGGVIGLIVMGIWGALLIGIFGLFFDYILSTYLYGRISALRSLSHSRWGGGGGFGGGSSGGWGGFGGGGFGGGGASGKW